MIEQVLKRIEAEDQDSTVWIVGPQTGKLLSMLLQVLLPQHVLEVGTSVGYSALWMALALQKNGGGKIWTVESHTDRFNRAKANIAEAGMTEWIEQRKGHAPEIFEEGEWPDAWDFVFLDATKMEHQSYFDAVFPKLKPGSMLAVDNVQSHRFGQMEKFIGRLYENTGLKVVEIPVGDGLLLARVE